MTDGRGWRLRRTGGGYELYTEEGVYCRVFRTRQDASHAREMLDREEALWSHLETAAVYAELIRDGIVVTAEIARREAAQYAERVRAMLAERGG